jgi:hypothetical protein
MVLAAQCIAQITDQRPIAAVSNEVEPALRPTNPLGHSAAAESLSATPPLVPPTLADGEHVVLPVDLSADPARAFDLLAIGMTEGAERRMDSMLFEKRQSIARIEAGRDRQDEVGQLRLDDAIDYSVEQSVEMLMLSGSRPPHAVIAVL